MREIKFRAWDISHKRMWHDILVKTGLNGKTTIFLHFPIGAERPWKRDDHGIYTDSANAVPMQYTGLKDKGGKEIYEGDIVRIDNEAANKVHQNWVSHPIQLVEPFNVKFPQTFWIMHPYLEVIGNTYESPELLKGEDPK